MDNLQTPLISINRGSQGSVVSLNHPNQRRTSGHVQRHSFAISEASVSSQSQSYNQSHRNSNVSRKGSNVHGFNRTGVDNNIHILWPIKPPESAPEINLLTKKPTTFVVNQTKNTCMTKLLRCLGAVCKNKVADGCGLDEFKPLIARTDHTMQYVQELARKHLEDIRHTSNSPSSHSMVSTKSGMSDATLKSSNKETKSPHFQSFFDKSYQTLKILHQCTGHFKDIIYSLTYTKYAEGELTESETKLARGRSIIGSYMWIVIFALQQLQEDPEISPAEAQPKPHPGIYELALELHYLITLSLQTWQELVMAIGVLEKMHQKTEEVFQRQTTHLHSIAAPESAEATFASLHLKTYRRAESDVQELKSLKAFDPYASLLVWNRRHSMSRIMYKFAYEKPDSLWNGFDVLHLDKKIVYLKDILNFVRLIFENVRDNAHKVSNDLQSHAGGHRGSTSSHLNINTRTAYSSGIKSYDEGLTLMDDILVKKLDTAQWSEETTNEFFEVDKIFLDDMDLITLSAGVTRQMLHESRHMMHICYETSRLLDFREFSALPPYERIYHKVKEDFKDKSSRKARKSSLGASYDIEEIHLELRNVAGLFRTSIYHEILKHVPIYTNRVGITLQDSELVFTPSSEKLLSE